MIFEQLEYAVTCFDNERKKEIRQSDVMDGDVPIHEMGEMHDEHMQDLYDSIRQIKKLYKHTLPTYEK